MRQLKLQMQITVDGYVAGPNGEMDMLTWNWGDDIKNYVGELTDSIDTILLGRKMAGGFIDHWTNAASNEADPSYPFAKKMVDAKKVVFSKTLDASTWENTDLAKGDLNEEVRKLKVGSGKDMIVYGGANFVSNLIRQNLIDEYHLFVNPVVTGKGMTIYGAVGEKMGLKLVKATPFDCGIVTLLYRAG
jgi:dihydrofolate reductase